MSRAIVTRGLQKQYGNRAVLHAVDLSVDGGELLGLIGPNGAGKSTLLRCLCGLVRHSAGDVRCLDRDPRRDSLWIRQHSSYLPGETGVYRQMTGKAFLEFALGFYPHRHADLHRRLLDSFELPLHKRVRSYSAGMKQKLALVATLVPDVDLYLLDEPDRALDASVRFFLRDVLRELHRRGKTIVLSSHHLSEVETLADRLVFLLDGSFVAAERIEEARRQLRRQPRVRLCPGHELPSGAKLLRTEPDGALVLETDGDPIQWLRTCPSDAIDSVEIGIDRLEDLYRVLLERQEAAR